MASNLRALYQQMTGPGRDPLSGNAASEAIGATEEIVVEAIARWIEGEALGYRPSAVGDLLRGLARDIRDGAWKR